MRDADLKSEIASATRHLGNPDMDEPAGQSESRFFKYLWRFNALAVAAVSIILGVLGLYATVMIFKEETRPRRVTNVVNVSDKDKISEDFSLGLAVTLEGTPYVKIPLYRGQAYAASYYPKSSERNDVNYLFVNIVTGDSRWLFESAAQLVTDSDILYAKVRNSPGDPRVSVGIMYTLVEKDTNGDSRLTNKDAVSLAVSNVDGSQFRKLVEGVERVYFIRRIADDKVLVVYQKDQGSIFELYSVPSMIRAQQSSIPKIKLN